MTAKLDFNIIDTNQSHLWFHLFQEVFIDTAVVKQFLTDVNAVLFQSTNIA